MQRLTRQIFLLLSILSTFCVSTNAQDAIESFESPLDSAKPGVYWFFMDANLTQSGMLADLEAMKRAGLGRAIVMEADQGGPKGNVPYMSKEWLDCWTYATQEARRLGIELTTSVGPGWCGAGGPWITPEHSMQHLRASFVTVDGGQPVDVVLAKPEPREPYFGMGSLGPCEQTWREFYRDVAVLAFPTPKSDAKLPDWEEKALFYRPPYSSMPGVKPYLPTSSDSPETVAALHDAVVPVETIVDVSERMDASGRLQWTPPAGTWTIARLGRRVTGQTTRPAPAAGLGLESDKFEPTGIDEHFANFDAKLFDVADFVALHHDSWEMSSQNWSEHFRALFKEKRGYDPLPWTLAMFGIPVESVNDAERFLWDLRRTAQELTYENNVERMKKLGAERGLSFSEEAYDLNPAGDLYLFRAADVPMCEFWAKGYGFETWFSVVEAASSAHTTGKSIVGAESFTTAYDKWRQHPGIMKRQADWAFCAGVNRLIFHRMCAQPNDDAPGFSLGPHGTHFDRTQTWFPLVDDFTKFVTRAQATLQRGLTSADVLYLDREDAPSVFTPPSSAFLPGEFKDKREYNFDGCCPQVLLDDARAENGKIVFPDGASYSLLVLPSTNEMTLDLARKLKEFADAGVTIVGAAPSRTPSLVDKANADRELQTIVDSIWNGANKPIVPEYKAASTSHERQAIRAAKWIWANDQFQKAPKDEKRTFVKTFELPKDVDLETLKNAYGVATADNVYTFYLNDVKVGSGDNFHSPDVFSIADALRPGVNVARVEVFNGGDAPNPAGMIAALRLNDELTIGTDATWKNADESNAVELGAFDMAPWGLQLSATVDPDATYPEWSVVQNALRKLGVASDFESTGDVRWIHKIDGDLDVYYVGNRLETEQTVECSFRVAGKKAQLWNPIDGKRYVVDDAREENGRTIVPIRFEESQSFFVVFGAQDPDEQKLAKSSEFLAPKRSESLVDLSNDWTVEFDQNAAANRDFDEGRAKTVQFDALQDWSKSSDPYLKYYSGLARYARSFDFPSRISEDETYALEFDEVDVMARVTLNGQKVATLWTKPYRVEIPARLLRDKGNELEIVVANLWCNRLIGDASRPAERRFTRASNPMWGPGDDQLQPSGLLGALKLVKRVVDEKK